MKMKLLIAGGGTGGHIFPGIAIAQEWVKRGGEVVFVGTRQGQEGQIIPRHGFELRFLKVGRLKGGSLLQRLKTLVGLPLALLRATVLVLKERPHRVLGIGGYASGPACVAARLLGKYTAVSDQNVHPGMTNRILGKIVHRVYVSFKESERFFLKKKVRCTGNPVRSEIERTVYTIPEKTFCIFVYGGSQGAAGLNAGFLQGINALPELWPQLKIYHQAGGVDIDQVKSFYQERQIRADVRPFFENMNELYKEAHLLVCRAGAGTVTELAISGRPAILVPLPTAADDHQKKNAMVFVNQNAAWLIEQKDMNAQTVSKLIREMQAHPEQLKTRADNISKMAIPHAAANIVDDLWAQGER